MTGSGSSIFGIFPEKNEMDAAAKLFEKEKVFKIRFVTRAVYRAIWRRRLSRVLN